MLGIAAVIGFAWCLNAIHAGCVLSPQPIALSVPSVESRDSAESFYTGHVIGEVRAIALEGRCCDGVEDGARPVCLIARMIEAVRRGDFDGVESMYSADTRMAVRELLDDDEGAAQIQNFWQSRDDFHVSIYWLVAPNYLIAYVVSGDGDVYMPFVLQYTNRWHLVAGKIPFKSELSDYIDLYYARRSMGDAGGEMRYSFNDGCISHSDFSEEFIKSFETPIGEAACSCSRMSLLVK